MTIELPKEARDDALASLQRYCRENLDEPLGNVAAAGLLDFFIEEIGPLIYNKAVTHVQERLQRRVEELDIDMNQEAFAYWSRRERESKRRR